MASTQDPITDLAELLHQAGLDNTTVERKHGHILIRLTPDDTAALARLLNLDDAWSLAMGLPPLGIRYLTCCITPEISAITLTDGNTRHLATRIRYAL
ncbi:hypothetical protein GCM10009837_07030 [Streptomyces durmitorensis]|uniref:Uncharacterized protein n=1 Tax=Streptomyces durmitorensis TaxID=319947 RepID=A0ABY4PMR6_9ACTN|nr:hypothetical protein [Streptomyces durmitorensis]UQT54402.1 hypothetical protein M4V62_04470 [Streptomyces durmitorensis]